MKKYKYISQRYWEESLGKKDWYLRLAPEFRKYILSPDPKKTKNIKETKREIYHIVNEFYKNGRLSLGASGENWDSERKPVRHIVLHHTSARSDISLSLLSTVQMVRLYVNQYLLKKEDLKYPNDPVVYGQPLWSNHFRRGKMVFFAYHWLIRPDGTAQRLLQDDQVGWHAGSWQINCASVAICFSGDFENKIPNKKMLDAAVKIIKENYPKVPKKNILGHGETRPVPTSCPGKYLGHIKKYIKERI